FRTRPLTILLTSNCCSAGGSHSGSRSLTSVLKAAAISCLRSSSERSYSRSRFRFTMRKDFLTAPRTACRLKTGLVRATFGSERLCWVRGSLPDTVGQRGQQKGCPRNFYCSIRVKFSPDRAAKSAEGAHRSGRPFLLQSPYREV